MKLKKSVLLVTALLLAMIASAQNPAPGLQLTIQMDSSTYQANEAIRVRILLANAGESHLAVNNRMLVNAHAGPHELYVHILSPSGNTVPFQRKIRASFESKDFAALLPNHMVGLDYDLTKDHDLTEPGTYTIRVYYENHSPAPEILGLPGWQGSLESNQLTFTVRQGRR